jgi:hypothetical protein
MPGDNATARDYDDQMSERLLGIAADVLRSFGSAFGGRHLAIVGGIVPTIIVLDPPPGLDAHVGTADLDLHLSLHLLDGETADYYDAIIDGLKSLGLKASVDGERERKWRWVGRYRGIELTVELLCPARTTGGRPEMPAADTPAEANIGPGREITALAIGLGHLVPVDTVFIPRRVEASGGSLTYEFPVAGLASWLCLKSDAIMRRNKPKDAYDMVWLIDALGPEVAAEQIATSPLLSSELADEVRHQLRMLILDQFKDTDSIGPRSYATFLEAAPGNTERRHAHGTLATLGDVLSARGIG